MQQMPAVCRTNRLLTLSRMRCKLILPRGGWVIFLTALMLLNYAGIGHYFGLFLIPVLLYTKGITRYFTWEAVSLLLFSLTYTAFLVIYKGITGLGVGTLLLYLWIPLVGYQAGFYLMRVNVSGDTVFKILYLLMIACALLVMASVFIEIRKNGFVGGGGRNLPLIGGDDTIVSATGLGARLSVLLAFLGIPLGTGYTAGQRRWSLLLFAGAVVCLIFTVRLGTRTGIVIALFSAVTLLIYNFRHYSAGGRIGLLLLLGIVGIGIMNFIEKNSELLLFYMDRMGNETAGIATGGGRTELWAYYGSKILSYPFGNMPDHPFLNEYAHNLWIDVARRTGIIPLAFLLAFFFSTWRNIYRFIRFSAADRFLKNVVLVVTVAFMLQFSVEPVLEGMFMLFVLYCLFCGMIKRYLQTDNCICRSKAVY